MKGFKGFHRFPISGMAAVLFSCLLVLSCSDDIIESSKDRVGKHSDNICFGISPADEDWTKASAGTGAASVKDTEYYVLRAENSSDTLCLRATVTDGISVSAFGNDAPETRSAQVVSLETYGSFRVQAHCTDAGVPVGVFYMDDVADNLNAGVWSTRNVYYWPGEDRTLRFFAWAPVDAAFTSVPESPENTVLGYEVPQAVADQKDVVVAVTSDIPGNSNTEVPLGFRHICSAIRFEFGREMQPGTIKSVELKNVKYAGSYDMASDTWALNDGVASFKQDLGLPTTGNEPDDSPLTKPEGTFMMVPQTLPDGAEVEVVFVDGVTGQEREPMTVSIAGSRWPQGMTVTYKLSITPEYDLEFTSEPEIQDAHYVIYPINIKAGNIPGGWTLTSTDPSVTLRTEHTVLTRRGFWIERDRGGASISSTAVGDNITVLAFLEENVGETTREVNLELRPTNMPNAIPRIFTISQLCPSWNGDLGCERIEDADYPWGFMWPDGMKITYNMRNAGLLDLIKNALLNAYLSWFTDYNNFVTKETWALSITSVTINFDAVPQVLVATSEDDGKRNTDELYNFNGISDVATLMSILEDWGGTTTDVLPLNPEEFAARACVMKNKFGVTIESSGLGSETIEVPVLAEEDLVWYLPSKNEASRMQDTGEYALDGIYWTSTNYVAEDEHNENAYIYTAGGSTSVEKRNVYHHVRAVRKKPIP
ncbi:hypothetical protein B5F83_06095 [Muribaculum sp. An289]|uniref:fimbrillin family protein n=1 Tax=unclassified Muribaculum TaxID=2622126 RepID=UPI000B3A74D5|nr:MULTISPECIES: fimbrillin family protein [unclassified Muribaculum]OUO36935.1 hypothetical protein B5F83_06095 [Muribaculum sp. An289]OUO42882.1 hypothetical protein B5F81_05815 [Muribaculum sp. An287]